MEYDVRELRSGREQIGWTKLGKFIRQKTEMASSLVEKLHFAQKHTTPFFL